MRGSQKIGSSSPPDKKDLSIYMGNACDVVTETKTLEEIVSNATSGALAKFI
jgi:hypothetical protein